MKILAINPGSTSTKIGVFNDCELEFNKTLRHSVDELHIFEKIIDQRYFRKQIILDGLKEANCALSDLDACVGRGGLLKPIPGGVYRVTDALIDDLHKEILGEHASNLGGILAREIAEETGRGIGAFIVDPVVVDEYEDLARFSGHPQLPRISIFHALNQKAVARRHARENGKPYESMNLIVAHLGGGITVGAHKKGKVVEVNNGLDGGGPFSPERSGTLPIGALVKMCFSRRYQYAQIKKMITGRGGCVAYLGTNNAAEIEERIAGGDENSRRVFEAMAYQIAREIGSCATVMKGEVDAILITGGMAHSGMITNWISERVSFIAPVKVYPGEDELQALAENVYYALSGEIEIKDYV